MKASKKTNSNRLRDGSVENIWVGPGRPAIAGARVRLLLRHMRRPSHAKVSLETYPDPGQMRITFAELVHASSQPGLQQRLRRSGKRDERWSRRFLRIDWRSRRGVQICESGVPYSRMDNIFLTHLHGDT